MSQSRLDILTQSSRPLLLQREKSREVGVIIGVLCTLLLHVLLFCLSPLFPVPKYATKSEAQRRLEKYKSFDVQLVPLEAPKPKPNPFNFVETNPNAPTNEPDNTSNFSNRNQQSAQEVAAKEKDPENRPSVTGRQDIKDSSAIVSGDHSQVQQAAEAKVAPAKLSPEQQKHQEARSEQVPLSGMEKVEGKNPDGIGSNNSQSPAEANDAKQLVDGSKTSHNPDGAVVATEETQHQVPKPRPRLSSVRSTVLANRITGTSNVGVVGIDARWSEYGDYEAELIETIDREWHGILEESNLHYKANSKVGVTFTINSKGEVQVTAVENFADDVAVGQCKSAITNPQPYRKWTDQMIAVMGHEQSITIEFYYY